MKKRVLSALLALALVCGSIPVQVFATGGETAPQQPAATQVESQGEEQDTPQDEEQGTPQGDTQGEVQGEPTPQGELQPAAPSTGSVTYLDENGDLRTYEGEYTELTGNYHNSLTEGWYLVKGEVTVFGTQAVSGKVTFVLANGAKLDYMEPLKLESGGSLTVTAQSKDSNEMGGMEILTGEGSAVSIASGASFTVNGGDLDFQAGGADAITCNGSLTVNGGCLSGQTGRGKGIGGSGSITINGGRVEAHGGPPNTTVIDGSHITISGGVVVANDGMGVIGEWGSSCSTGENGNAMIYAASFSPSNPNASYILFGSYIGLYEKIGSVYGNVELDENLTLESKTRIDVGYDASLTIPAGVTLTVTAGSRLANSGSIINNGTILIEEGGSVTGNAISGNPAARETSYLDPATGASVSVAAQPFAADTALESGWYLVSGEVTVPERITVSGDVNLILENNAHLNAQGGIEVSAGNSLTITAQSTGEEMGRLTATGSSNNAGIGGNGGSSGISGGSITINGGDIEATGGDDDDNGFGGAGIGGGNNGAGGSIEINGGVITATGGGEGAGIGGGNYGSGGNITITGGVIEATGGEGGAGIGGGYEGTGGTISISGGTVVAAGDRGGAGIGGGYRGRSGDITINGGSITADGSSTGGAGIGGGGDRAINTILITGGTIRANGHGSGSYGIGMGSSSGGAGTALRLTGNAVIYANAIERSDEENWNCIWFKGTAGAVYGSVTLEDDLTVEAGQTLTVEAGASLTRPADVSLVNEGRILVRVGGSYAGEDTKPNPVEYEQVSYLDENGETRQVTESVQLLTAGTTALESGWYLVEGNVTLGSRLTVNGEVTLILADNAHLDVQGGVEVSEGSSLTITAQSKEEGRMGALTATSSGDAAGIGGKGSTVKIWGGKVDVTGDLVGIGGQNSTVVIRGGVVSASSTLSNGTSNYGIGSEDSKVTISGGRVTADSGRVNGFDIFGSVLSTDKPDGGNGNAVICWGSMSINSAGADYIWADGQEKNYRVYGEVTLTDSFEVGQEATLTVEPGATLTVPEGVTLKNNGTIKVEAGGRYVGAETSPNPVEYEQVPYLDENGEEKLTTGPVGLVTNSTTELESGWYLVKNRITIPQRLTVSGEVTIILADWCELNAQGGIEVSEGNSLTITAQSKDKYTMGSLTAMVNGGYNAAIGGNYKGNTGSITINGGRITADARYTGTEFGRNGAGIGGGISGASGDITINGGVVTANGDTLSAGIGGGAYGRVGTITINGGKVTATGGGTAAGIGSGLAQGSEVGNGSITITGGSITATGGASYAMSGGGAGIGGSDNSTGGSITISGGTVRATSGEGAQAIGNGMTFSTGDGNAIITAATITGSEDTSGWNCIWFESESGDGSVFGEVTLEEDLTIGAGRTLTVEPGATLTVPAGVNFTNNGTIKVELGGALVSAQQVDGVLYYVGWDTDEDGEAEEADYLAYGEGPVYTGEEPVKENTAQYTYTFCGWSPAVAAVTGPVLYKAQFDAKVNRYTVSLPENPVGYTLEYDGALTLDWGETFTFTLTLDDGYSMTGDFAVKANGETLTGAGDLYTFKVTGDTTVTVDGVADITAPDTTLTVAENPFKSFLNKITFGLFFNEDIDVTLEATDAGSGVVELCYLRSETALTEDALLESDKWVAYTGKITETAQDAEQFIYYAKAVDAAGNVALVSSDGVVFDLTAPAFSGVTPNGVYYTTQQVTVSDANLDTVTLNGEPVGETVTLPGDVEASYTLEATDKVGNTATITVTMQPIDSLLPPDPATSADQAQIEQLQQTVEALLAGEMTTDEREKLKAVQDAIDEALDRLEQAGAAQEEATESAGKVEGVTPDTVKPADKEDLEAAKEDLENALDNFGDNYTEAERKELEDALDRVNEALDRLEQAGAAQEEATESVGKVEGIVPDTVKPTDKEDLAAAKEDLENALDNFGDNYTEAEREELEDALDRVNEALDRLEQAGAAQDEAAESIGKVEGIVPDTVKPTDKEDLEAAKEDLENALDNFGDNYTEEEREELEDALDRVNEALDRLEQAEQAGNTESIDKVEGIVPDTVKPTDKADLEAAKEDLENALDNFGDNYTEAERKELEDALDRVNGALESLERVEGVQGAVDALPDTLEPDDLETVEKIEAAKEQFDRLTDHEKELAAAAGEKLDALLDAAGDYRILSGNGSSWTQGGSGGVTIVANGAPERLIDLLLDGNSIDPAQVTVEKGSTIVTLKPAYLATLAAGQHALTFVYENGQVSATFTIAASGGESGGAAGGNAGNTAAGSPNTGDATNPALWVVVAAVCIGALVALVVWRRRKNAQR